MTKILIAEDEEAIRELYEDCLSTYYNQGDLTFKATGDEAISALEEMLSKGEKPELVITDNKMPPGKLTGMDVIDYVRAKLPDTKVIMIAGEDSEMTVKKTALQKGASAYLSKPFKLQELLATVRKYSTPDK